MEHLGSIQHRLSFFTWVGAVWRRQVIAATNRPDVLDPALLRSGRLDRKIELPHPNEDARERILQIHARKMTVNKAGELSKYINRCTDQSRIAKLHPGTPLTLTRCIHVCMVLPRERA